jgi:hypothetical protein
MPVAQAKGGWISFRITLMERKAVPLFYPRGSYILKIPRSKSIGIASAGIGMPSRTEWSSNIEYE